MKTNRNRDTLFRDLGDLLEAAGARDWLGLRESPVCLKPNLVVGRPSSGGATTTPQIAEGLVAWLRDGGYGNISIAEGSWVGESTARAFRVCGYGDLAERYGLALIDLQKDEWVSRQTGEGPFLICRYIAELEECGGSLINLPLIKGHGQTRVTCALKNLKGCIPDSEKRRYHALGVHRPVARLNTLIRPAFALADGLNPDPCWEEGGSPERRDLLLLGRDPVSLDSLACRLLGVPEEDVPYIARAEQLGIGKGHISPEEIIDLDGSGRVDFLPEGGMGKRLRGEIDRIVDQRSACSSCFGHLASALREMDDLQSLPDRLLCIGQEFRGEGLPAGKIGIGSCAAGENGLPGCPPSRGVIGEFLRDRLSR